MKHARTDYERIQDPWESDGGIGRDEPVFLFRAKDVLTPIILARYAELLRQHGCQQEMIDSTLLWEAEVRKWARINGCKLPDMPVPNLTEVVTEHFAKTPATTVVTNAEKLMDFSGWVGHRARMANNRIVKITGGVVGLSIGGHLLDDDSKQFRWAVDTGENTQSSDWDLVELLDGPTKNRKGE